MLTKDQSIVAVAITIQYRIARPKNYLFSVVNPQQSLQQATISALRQEVGHMPLGDILTKGREVLRDRVKQQLIHILKPYKVGLDIVNTPLKEARAPDAVQDAFDDAVKAQEDEKRFVNQAHAYVSRVVPVARGEAKRTIEQANGFQQQIVLQARAKVKPYLALLPRYKQAPEVMRTRMYLNTMEKVFKNSHKILLDTPGSHNMLYLPLKQWMGQSGATDTEASDSTETAQLPKIPSKDLQKVAQVETQGSSKSLPNGYAAGGSY
jgi:membrane protease subunit HflK